MDVAEQSPLLGLPEPWSRTELAHAADVVEERRSQQEICAQARMELCGLATERRDADGVLEETARVPVVSVGTGCGKRSQRASQVGVAGEGADEGGEAGMRELGREELEEPVELVGVPPEGGRQLGGIGVCRRLHRSYLHLEPAAEALDASQHMHRVALGEPLVEELDVAPDARLDASARVRELQGEVRRARPGPSALLPRDREHALHGPVLGELGDRGHGLSLSPRSPLVRSPAMADVQPFRAVRYSGAAGPLGELVAPPYDTVSDDERALLYTRSPLNVAHLTLPESAEEAGRLYREWLADGILEQEDEPSAWLLVEDFVGPDGVPRERRGVVASLAAEPYALGGVLPHERTHPHVREERLKLLRATGAQPEPIFLLHEGRIEAEVPERSPDAAVDGTRLWRAELDLSPLAGEELLVADGHHRYESAVELGVELGPAGARIMALLVSTEDPGLHVYPTHRLFSGRPDLARPGEGERFESLVDALDRLARESYGRSTVVAYRPGRVELVRGPEGELDVELVDRHGLEGIAYTPQADEAVAAVDQGRADVAFFLREPRVEDLFAVARKGERMPQKSTYFFPKPLSGLLFHPVSP